MGNVYKALVQYTAREEKYADSIIACVFVDQISIRDSGEARFLLPLSEMPACEDVCSL